MNLRDFIKRHRDDLNRFAADWDRAIAQGRVAAPTTHERWLAALRFWIKADNEPFADQPTIPRAQKPPTGRKKHVPG